jgi:hypothetical protein
MRLSDQSRLKKPFLVAGGVAGAVGSAWYLYRNQLHGKVPGSQTLPDPVWVQFVNVVLILFVAIYLANLLRRIVERLLRKGKQGK